VRGVTALWTSDEIAAATGGTASARFEVTGVTFDSREVQSGDLFVAMPGTVHDGHKFVDGAFASGAAGAIVSQPVSGPHVLVEDTFAALQALGRASRDRSKATVFGVTGSVGKTSTKEALYAALDRNRPGEVHRSVKSYNNHTGVPLSLARMPRDVEFAVFEMGMNIDGAGAPACRADHRYRPGPHREPRVRTGDCRCQGRDIRKPRTPRRRHCAQRHAAARPAGEGRAPPCRPDHYLR
jgi:UDP-N-acetylmuramoyl-tripeptide--D-alanyl-D-alanine ligase